MATYINNIFNFGRSLPSPFDTIANKKIKVSSKYGDGTTSTLCGTVIKAVHAVCHCMDGSGEGAVGIIDHRTAAEYKSSAGADAYHLVVYDSNTGSLMASVYDSINTGHPLVTKVKGRENRYQLVCGMFAHELGHVLFTDFLSAQTYHNYLDSFKWYPRPPAFQLAADARNEKAFWEYVKEDPKNLQMVHQIAANIANTEISTAASISA